MDCLALTLKKVQSQLQKAEAESAVCYMNENTLEGKV